MDYEKGFDAQVTKLMEDASEDSHYRVSDKNWRHLPLWRKVASTNGMRLILCAVVVLGGNAVPWVPFSILVLANPAYTNTWWAFAGVVILGIGSLITLVVGAIKSFDDDWLEEATDFFARQAMTAESLFMLEKAARAASRAAKATGSWRTRLQALNYLRKARKIARSEFVLQKSLAKMVEARSDDPIVDQVRSEVRDLRHVVAQFTVALQDLAEVEEAARVQRVARQEVNRSSRREKVRIGQAAAMSSDLEALRNETSMSRIRVISEASVTGVKPKLRNLQD